MLLPVLFLLGGGFVAVKLLSRRVAGNVGEPRIYEPHLLSLVEMTEPPRGHKIPYLSHMSQQWFKATVDAPWSPVSGIGTFHVMIVEGNNPPVRGISIWDGEYASIGWADATGKKISDGINLKENVHDYYIHVANDPGNKVSPQDLAISFSKSFACDG